MKCPKCHSDNTDTARFCSSCATPLLAVEDAQPSFTKTLETPVEELTRGTLFADRYEIIEELGRGGMGSVYRVEDTKVKEEVALKLIKPEIAADKKTIDRFSHELKVARKIVHKNVGRMYDINEEKGIHYITMEYVPGQDLKGLIRQSGQLAIGTAISIAKQICEGLTEAHILSVVHRDLKPSNIMIDKEGNARIMDFGIARSLKAKGITGAGVMIGTPEYMSPEQVEGKDVDQRSDIYSLGVILYEMVTGRVPFEGDTPLSIAVKQKTEKPPDPQKLNPQIPDDLSRVILRCMGKDKENRYQSAGEVHTELNRIEKGIPLSERVVSKRKPITSKEITVTVGLKKLFIPALIVVAITVIAVFLYKGGGPELDPDLVAVAVFENQTGDESLDPLGRMAADWITQGLSQTGIVRVVPTTTFLPSTQMAGPKADIPQGKEQLRALAEETGAGTIVSGVYYLADRELQFHAIITDIQHRKLIHSLEPIKGPHDSKMEIIEKLRQRIMGAVAIYFKAEITASWESMRPPTFEAYLEYWTGLEYFAKDYGRAIRHFERAIELDPDFLSPYLRIASAYGNMGEYEKRDSILHFLDSNRERLTPFERHLLDWSKSSSQGKYSECLRFLQQAKKIIPKDAVINYLIGNTAVKINDPQMAVDTFARIEPPWLGYVPGTWMFRVLASAHHMLGNYKEELKVVYEVRKHYPDMLSLRAHEVRALAALGRVKEIKKVISESMVMKSQYGTAGDVMLEATQELRAHGHPQPYREIANQAVEWYLDRLKEKPFTENKRFELARALYVAERWEESLAIFEKMSSENPDNIDYRGYLGALAARKGDREGALRISNRLKNIDRPYLNGKHIYWRACIASLLGELQQAVELFQDAIAEGLAYDVYLHRDMDLEPLRDYPPFKELIKPKR